MPKSRLHPCVKRHAKRRERHHEQRAERLYSQSIQLARPVPPWDVLLAEARSYYRYHNITEAQVLTYARHAYTNYDLLMGRVRRRVKKHNVAADMARQQWHAEAKRLVLAALQSTTAQPL